MGGALWQPPHRIGEEVPEQRSKEPAARTVRQTARCEPMNTTVISGRIPRVALGCAWPASIHKMEFDTTEIWITMARQHQGTDRSMKDVIRTARG
jgi:hypothetical protein